MLGKYQYDRPYLLVYDNGHLMPDTIIQEFETELQMENFIKKYGIEESDVFVCCKVDKHFNVKKMYSK